MTSILASLLDGLAKVAAPQTAPRARRSDLFANPPVFNQFGRKYRFKEDFIKDRAVVINTMFTVCRGTCPGTSATLQRLRAPLSKLFGKRATILSISIDPNNDTPAVLKEYANDYGAAKPAGEDACDWHFLTGTPEHIESLRRSLGFYDLDAKVDADITRHAAVLLFGNDQTDRWATSPSRIRDGLIWEPMRRILGTTPRERFGIRQA